MSTPPSPVREWWPWALLAVAVALHLAMMGSLFWGYFDAFAYTTDRSLQAVDFFGVYEAGQRAHRR